MIETSGDTIFINDKSGIKKTAEIVSKFDIEGLGKYIIYK